jgi:hypothetical protein
MGGLLTVPLKMVCIIRTNTCLCCGLNTFFHEGRGRVVNTPASYCCSMNDVTITQSLFPAVHFSSLRQLRCKGKESYCDISGFPGNATVEWCVIVVFPR